MNVRRTDGDRPAVSLAAARVIVLSLGGWRCWGCGRPERLRLVRTDGRPASAAAGLGELAAVCVAPGGFGGSGTKGRPDCLAKLAARSGVSWAAWRRVSVIGGAVSRANREWRRFLVDTGLQGLPFDA